MLFDAGVYRLDVGLEWGRDSRLVYKELELNIERWKADFLSARTGAPFLPVGQTRDARTHIWL